MDAKMLGLLFSLFLNGDFDHRVANDLVFDPVALLEYLDDLARVVGHLFHHRVVQFGVKGLALRGDLLLSLIHI